MAGPRPSLRPRLLLAGIALALLAGIFWLRAPTFGFAVWNVDEAIHAAVARTLLDGGVLYRDAVDQRTPVSYYAVALIFSLAGENNLWAVHAGIALLIAGTAFALCLIGRAWAQPAAGLIAALLYGLLSVSLLYPGDAFAANTEWFAAFFASAATLLFWTGRRPPSTARLLGTGSLLGLAFLSKQPSLLEGIAPAIILFWIAWREEARPGRALPRIGTLCLGWLFPVLAATFFFAAHGALRDAFFYTWTYNLTYYGPEITLADRLATLTLPLRLLLQGPHTPLLVFWLGGLGFLLYRLSQRQPTPDEISSNPQGLYLLAWNSAALFGAASSGRGFDHYAIQLLPPLCLVSGLAISTLLDWSRRNFSLRVMVGAGLLVMAGALLSAALTARKHTFPLDPSHRVSAYIRAHSHPDDRIFVWGFHPEIYLHSERKPASRFVFASFLTGLIPWTNTAPAQDTTYAIVPGALDLLIAELSAAPPRYIVDCSAGPNRFWDKYPLENFPELAAHIQAHYHPIESGQFVPQGFRLWQLRTGPAEASPAPAIQADKLAAMALPVFASSLAPQGASAPFGVDVGLVEGRREFFMHAPASLTYQVPRGTWRLRGAFGFRPAAYADGHPGATDGAEFSVQWTPGPDSPPRMLWQRLLRPREEIHDRGLHSFTIDLPPHHADGRLELRISPGPSDNPASDWTFWSDLVLETSP